MDKPLIVCCFYWQGDRWEDDGRQQLYINRLYHMVSRHLTIPFKFICYTNDYMHLVVGIDQRKFDMPTKRGVLPRMYMFSEESGLFGHQVLALDLDIIIVGSLDEIASYQGPFASRSKFAPGQEWKLDGDVTSFSACQENADKFWVPYRDDPATVIKLTEGRERYWFRHIVGVEGGDRWNTMMPGQVVSYKRHCKTNGNQPPKNARIVSCHGRPRPHEMEHLDWVRENWK